MIFVMIELEKDVDVKYYSVFDIVVFVDEEEYARDSLTILQISSFVKAKEKPEGMLQ